MSTSSVSIKNSLNKFSGLFKKNIGLAFWLIFLLILTYEFFVINRALKPIINPEPIPETKKTQGVRYNFDDYNQVVNTINSNKLYEPESGVSKNPFLLGQ